MMKTPILAILFAWSIALLGSCADTLGLTQYAEIKAQSAATAAQIEANQATIASQLNALTEQSQAIVDMQRQNAALATLLAQTTSDISRTVVRGHTTTQIFLIVGLVVTLLALLWFANRFAERRHQRALVLYQRPNSAPTYRIIDVDEGNGMSALATQRIHAAWMALRSFIDVDR